MNVKGTSRKEFLQGVLASMGLGFLGGRRLFAVSPGWTPSGAARLVFGVISDTHVRSDYQPQYSPPQFWRTHTDVRFRNAVSYFRDQHVDAIMHCGDWADKGGVEEMEMYKKAWDEIFPPGSSYQPVKLFVLGNHDFFDVNWMEDYWKLRGEDYHDHLIMKDPKGQMERIWGETYDEAWHKVVKGYHFFGYNFGEDFGGNGLAMAALIAVERAKSNWDVQRPFFTVSHYNPSDRVLEAVTNALQLSEGQTYCNGINFTGHWHISNARWDSISWPTKLCYPNIQCGSIGDKGWGGEDETPVFAKGFGDGRAEGCGNSEGNHGLLVKVYDDCIVISRLDFFCDTGNYNNAPNLSLSHNKPGVGVQPIGPDWVLTFDEITSASDGMPARHPFLHDELVKYIDRPEFTSQAKLKIENDEDCVRLEIPKADGNRDASGKLLSRVYGYNIEVVGQCGALRMSAYANGYNYGYGYEPDDGVTTVRIPKSDLPRGESLTFRTWPCSMLGTKGRPLAKTVRCVRVAIEKSVANVNRSGRFVLTRGAGLPSDTCVIADMPPWIRCVCVEDGDIVAYTRTADGAVLRLK